MSALELEPVWEEEIYQIELADPVEGGPDGVDNLPLKQLGNRTEYLKATVDPMAAFIASQTWINPAVADLATAAPAALLTYVLPSEGVNYVLEIELSNNAQDGHLWAAAARVHKQGGASAGVVGLRWKVASYDVNFTLDTSSGTQVVVKGQLSGGGAPGTASVLVRYRVVWAAVF